MEFPKFKSIPRLHREIIITEKIDGTNGLIRVTEDGKVLAGSRNRWLTLEQDNYDFCRWVQQHSEELKGLGVGDHYGEWWGVGIARKYNISERRFSLFNTSRWTLGNNIPPSCCKVVPVLEVCNSFNLETITNVSRILQISGSVAAPGFASPEGIVIFHVNSQTFFKYTFDGDGHKSQR